MVSNENKARTSVHLLFREDDLPAYEGAELRCIVTDEVHSVDLHHLDEHGSGDARSWFFENLVPVSSNVNRTIEASRTGSVGFFPEITSLALAGHVQAHFTRGRLIRAYACARLGAFLALNHERDPDMTVCLAAYALRALRGVATAWGLPLAIDTVDRSVIPALGPRAAVSPRACFRVAVGMGSFHKDYGDYHQALRYYRLAESFSALCGEYHWSTEEFDILISHYRALLVATGRPEEASSVREFLSSRSDFLQTPQGAANDLLWTLRAKRASMSPEEILESVDQLQDRILRCGSLLDWPPRMVSNSRLTAWTHAGYLSVIADAKDRLGAHSDAVEALAITAQLLTRFKLSPSFFAGQLPIFQATPDALRRDPALALNLRGPYDLQRSYRRTPFHTPLSFSHVSSAVMRLLEARVPPNYRTLIPESSAFLARWELPRR